MPRGPWHLIVPLLRRPAAGADSDPVSDAALLRRFAEAHDQAAFELLVWRHGALVLGACRRVLRDDYAAEDAFQATFLVLARKAGGVRTNLPAWLHRVARRVSLRLAKQRRRTETLAADPPARLHVSVDAELAAILDAEIDRLPDRFRRPVVLCYLGGRSTDDAAKELGVPRGTVLSRLATARQRLAARLTRRGITAPAAGLLAVGTAEPVAGGAVRACVAVAVGFASGTMVGTLPPIELAEGVLRMGTRITIATWAAVVLATAGLGTGVAVVAGSGDEPKAAAPPAPASKPPLAVANPPATPKPDRKDWLPLAVQRLSEEKAQLDRRAEVIQAHLAERDAGPLNPHVAKSMGEVLTQVELSIFKTQTEVRDDEAKIAELRTRLNALKNYRLSLFGQPPASYAPFPGGTAAVNNARFMLEQRERGVKHLAEQSAPDAPILKDARAQLATVREAYEAEVAKVTESYQKSEKERAVAEVESQFRPLEEGLQVKQRAVESLKKQRDEIVARLTKADRTQQDAGYRRLTDELAVLREQSAQIARTAMTLELEAKGALAAPAAAPDDRLDRILRELADLKAEVRRLSADRK